MQASSFHPRFLCNRYVLGDSVEECVNHTVWLALSALAHEAAMIEAGGHEHFPDLWIAPIVGDRLGDNLDVEIVMSTFEESRHRVFNVP